MVRNPFKKREKITPEIIVRHRDLVITHDIVHHPAPRPVMGSLVWTNQNGQRWQSQPFTINGPYAGPIQVPIAWLTGRDKDIAKLPVDVFLILEY